MQITRRGMTIGGLSLYSAPQPLLRHPALNWEKVFARQDRGRFWMSFALATDAYIFGYSLVTMEMTRRVITVKPRKGPTGRWDR